MRIAIFAVTVKGAQLARKLQSGLEEGATLFLANKIKRSETAFEDNNGRYFAKLGDSLRSNFNNYDALVCIMATGIVVRLIAPLLKSKLHDPAVVVFDEQGEFGISLLSGHIGGANELTKKLCAIVEAVPVITTATDVEGMLAPDALASKLGLRAWPKPNIQVINSALLEGKAIYYILDTSMVRADYYEARLREEGIKPRLRRWVDIKALESANDNDYRVVITDASNISQLGYDIFVDEPRALPANTLYLMPRCLIAGVGCRAGVSANEILKALDTACSRIGLDRSFIDLLASTVVKKNEPGLLSATATMMCKIKFYENDELADTIHKYGLTESEFVKETIGVGNVAEAAALYAAGKRGGRVALPRTKLQKVTVALIWEK